jgi:hypothetical protein
MYRIDKIYNNISKVINRYDNILLLRDKNIIQWIYGDLSFLHNKIEENRWGINIINKNGFSINTCWTHIIGEQLCKEIYILQDNKIRIPRRLCKYKPDIEVDNKIIEVKTQTYYNKGSIAEKVLGVPFKYIDIPLIYGKELEIICVGGIEKMSKEKYGNLEGIMMNDRRRELIEIYKKMGIRYVGLSDIIDKLFI